MPGTKAPTEVVVVPTNPVETPEPPPEFNWAPDIYLELDQNGILTVTAFRSEMGQGVRTALAMLVAEELDVEWSAVRIKQAPADRKYGNQVTGGSTSISTYYGVVRQAGATARQMLMNAAADAWDVDATQCKTEKGFVFHPDGQQNIFYGNLVQAASEQEKPGEVKVKESSQYKIVGTGIGHWDAPQFVTGKAIFGLDVRLPGMLFAAVARCPVFGGNVSSYDESATLAVPGVKQVVKIKSGVAVVAENSWAAIRGRDALKVAWNEGSNATLSSEGLIADVMEKLPRPGSIPANSIEAIYRIPYEAHATMEPMNCTAYVHDSKCEVWAPTQSPQEAQSGAAMGLDGISQNNIIVNVPLIGGGFGRRLKSDYVQEAAQISQAINAPVQVVWTREDDIQHDYYHPMALQYFQAALEDIRIPSGRIISSWEVPTGPWRSVDEFTKAYGEQCFIDEMAAALNRDPLDLRLELYQQNKRAIGVIKLAAEKANWGEPMPDSYGRGIAYFATFGVTPVAHVIEVSVGEDRDVRVHRVVCAVDCGQVVNPDNVAAQMEGGIAFGLTAALKAEATLKDGRIQQSNFHDYPILRLDEMPVIEVYIVPSVSAPSGIGEMGVPPVAPAVANAVFAATGKRIRHIPIRPEDLLA
jgi:isoquinoline 1-oxidoreductase beta subunit